MWPEEEGGAVYCGNFVEEAVLEVGSVCIGYVRHPLDFQVQSASICVFEFLVCKFCFVRKVHDAFVLFSWWCVVGHVEQSQFGFGVAEEISDRVDPWARYVREVFFQVFENGLLCAGEMLPRSEDNLEHIGDFAAKSDLCDGVHYVFDALAYISML